MDAQPAEILLTPREMDVLACAARDLTVEATAAALDIGYETVKTHRAHARAKLGCHTMAAAVARSYAPNVLSAAASDGSPR